MNNESVYLADKLSGVFSELQLMHIMTSGAIAIIENEGISTYAAVCRAGNEYDRMTFDSLAAVIYHIDGNLSRLMEAYTQQSMYS